MSEFKFRTSSGPMRALFAMNLAIVVLAAGTASFAWNAIKSNDETIAGLKQTVAQQQSVTASAGEGADGAGLLIEADTPQLAQATLSENVQKIADDLGLELEILRAGDVERADGMIKLNLVVSGVVPEPALGEFMSRISAERPVLVAGDMTLRRARDITRASEVRMIAFQLDLRAFMRG